MRICSLDSDSAAADFDFTDDATSLSESCANTTVSQMEVGSDSIIGFINVD